MAGSSLKTWNDGIVDIYIHLTVLCPVHFLYPVLYCIYPGSVLCKHGLIPSVRIPCVISTETWHERPNGPPSAPPSEQRQVGNRMGPVTMFISAVLSLQATYDTYIHACMHELLQIMEYTVLLPYQPAPRHLHYLGILMHHHHCCVIPGCLAYMCKRGDIIS